MYYSALFCDAAIAKSTVMQPHRFKESGLAARIRSLKLELWPHTKLNFTVLFQSSLHYSNQRPVDHIEPWMKPDVDHRLTRGVSPVLFKTLGSDSSPVGHTFLPALKNSQ
jgi:hypothetical protein